MTAPSPPRLALSFRLRLTVLFGLVLVVLGIVADHLAQDKLRWALETKLEKRAVGMARDLADFTAEALAAGDTFTMERVLLRTGANNPDARYLLIVDPRGRILASTFGAAVPAGLVAANRLSPGEDLQIRRLRSEEGIIRDVAVPAAGQAGTIRVGISDKSMEAALAGYSKSLTLALAGVIVAGLLFSYGLVGFLTRPLSRLTEAVRSVSRGNLAETVPAPGGDEFGQLALAFNEMTRSLADKDVMRQALLEKVITSQEEERKRIARDLHDDLAQVLTYVLLRLEDFQARVAGLDAGDRALLEQARGQLERSLRETRRLISDLRPSVLDDLGLVAALRSYAQMHLGAVGCQVEVSATASVEGLAAVTETAVFRIVQEAINNIAKHARARFAWIHLRRSAGRLLGEVIDDGCGYLSYDKAGGKVSELAGFGLQGMQERATLLGGSLQIRQPLQGGTHVSFDVPLENGRNG